MGVAMMGLSALERARGGRCAGLCAACCGAMRRSRGGGGARACRGQGAGVMCDGAADFLCRMLHVHAGVAVPGTLSKLQHSPAPSRVRNPHAMRVGVVAGRARGSDGLCLGMAVHPCCHCAPLSFASNKDVGLRTPVCRVLVVSRCVRDACHRVAECRSGGLGSGRKPVVSVCVKRVSSSWGSMPRFGPVLR